MKKKSTGALGRTGMMYLAGLILLTMGMNFLYGGDPSLVLHLKFDEGQGAVARDSSGRGHHAELIAPQWEEFGVRGKALRLDGARKAYVQLPLSEDFNLESNFTYSLWFKAGPQKYGMSLFLRGNYHQSFQIYFYESFVSFSCMKLKGRSLIYTRIPMGADLLFPFHQLVVTGQQQPGQDKIIIRFYLDGKLCRNDRRYGGQTDFVCVGKVPAPEKQPLCLGRFGSHEGQWYTGLIDEVKIYNRALTAGEIEKEYLELSEEEE